MESIRRNPLALAAAFVFAAGFAGSATAARDCSVCTGVYDTCMLQPDANENDCVLEHNRCAKARGCPFMPQT